MSSRAEIEAQGKQISDGLYRLKKPVVIVGMMGTGKSHIGRKLSEALKLRFRDSDRLIEHNAGCSINEIFARDGEEKFRTAEKNAVLELLSGHPCVIATGGGAVMNPEILSAIKEKSVSVWIRADIESLAQRLKNSKDRPLLQNGDPLDVLKKLLAAREPFYAQADIAIDSVEGSVDATWQDLLKKLSAFLKQARV